MLDQKGSEPLTTRLPAFGILFSPQFVTMPPQPGIFAVPYNANHKSSNQYQTDAYHHNGHHSQRAHGLFSIAMYARTATHRLYTLFVESDAKKEKKRKEIANRLGKEMIEKRDECVSLPLLP